MNECSSGFPGCEYPEIWPPAAEQGTLEWERAALNRDLWHNGHDRHRFEIAKLRAENAVLERALRNLTIPFSAHPEFFKAQARAELAKEATE